METSSFLPLPDGMGIGQIEVTATQLTVEVIFTWPCACCPECGCLFSDHIPCHYQRTVHDVPCGGRKMVLQLRARKFSCWAATCPRKVFAERLPLNTVECLGGTMTSPLSRWRIIQDAHEKGSCSEDVEEQGIQDMLLNIFRA